MNIKEKICLALDVEKLDDAKKLVDTLAQHVGVFKVGLQLYSACGNEIVDYIKEKNADFFLDIKLMDIPNTVKKASENIVLRGANFFNVHCLGGLEMMKAARFGADFAADKIGKKPPVILGVTMLTSISEDVLNKELEIDKNVSDYAIKLALLAKKAGLNGVVASAWELEKIKAVCGVHFKVLCPGIRPKDADVNDQKRIATPEDTLKKGADYIVLGRAVTSNQDPARAIQKIYADIERNL